MKNARGNVNNCETEVRVNENDVTGSTQHNQTNAYINSIHQYKLNTPYRLPQYMICRSPKITLNLREMERYKLKSKKTFQIPINIMCWLHRNMTWHMIWSHNLMTITNINQPDLKEGGFWISNRRAKWWLLRPTLPIHACRLGPISSSGVRLFPYLCRCRSRLHSNRVRAGRIPDTRKPGKSLSRLSASIPAPHPRSGNLRRSQ